MIFSTFTIDLLNMDKRWVLKGKGDNESVEKLARELNIDKYLVNLLVQRGVKTFEDARLFFRPELEDIYDPFLMKDMDKAMDRIETAIQKKEKILIYGDYDVDGTTAVALVYTYFNKIYDQLDFYIPDRYTEGYGISTMGIDYAADNNFSLIIALDCGIKAVEKVEYAAGKGVDFIICDHHRPGSELPAAFAVLDPKRPDCSYPYKELSGCGIGFKLIQAYQKRKNLPFSDLRQYLDLVVVSIASDIVDITGENRILAHYGLELINSQPRPWLEAILKYSNVQKNMKSPESKYFGKDLSISDLVFLVGPRINAAGRIESGRNSVRLLISETREEALELGTKINDNNTERKNLDTLATQQAIQMIAEDERLQRAKSTIIYNPDWHKGVIGIVASRLTEHYYRPTVV